MCRAGGRRCAGASTSRAAARERQRRSRANRRDSQTNHTTQSGKPQGRDVTPAAEPHPTEPPPGDVTPAPAPFAGLYSRPSKAAASNHENDVVRYLSTGRKGLVVRGPYRKYGQEWMDVVFPNEFGEPGQYSQRCPANQLTPWQDPPTAPGPTPQGGDVTPTPEHASMPDPVPGRSADDRASGPDVAGEPDPARPPAEDTTGTNPTENTPTTAPGDVTTNATTGATHVVNNVVVGENHGIQAHTIDQPMTLNTGTSRITIGDGRATGHPESDDTDQDTGQGTVRGGTRVVNYAAPGATVGRQAHTIVGDVTFTGAAGVHTTTGGGLPPDLADHVRTVTEQAHAAAEHARAAADRARADAANSTATARVTTDPGGAPTRLPDDVRDELARHGIQTGAVSGEVWVNGRRIH